MSDRIASLRLNYRWLVTTALLVAAPFLASCGDDDGCGDYDADCGPHRGLVQTSEDEVLEMFQVAWRERQISLYIQLLAADFRYIPDPATRHQTGMESWDREAESTRVECLFRDPDVKNILMDLGWPPRSAQSAGFAPPRDTWTRLFLTDVFLDVDVESFVSQVTTYRVQDQTQRIFFRKGRTWPRSGPGDTLVYIVEWRDDGNSDSKPTAAVEPTTWSKIKSLEDCSELLVNPEISSWRAIPSRRR